MASHTMSREHLPSGGDFEDPDAERSPAWGRLGAATTVVGVSLAAAASVLLNGGLDGGRQVSAGAGGRAARAGVEEGGARQDLADPPAPAENPSDSAIVGAVDEAEPQGEGAAPAGGVGEATAAPPAEAERGWQEASVLPDHDEEATVLDEGVPRASEDDARDGFKEAAEQDLAAPSDGAGGGRVDDVLATALRGEGSAGRFAAPPPPIVLPAGSPGAPASASAPVASPSPSPSSPAKAEGTMLAFSLFRDGAAWSDQAGLVRTADGRLVQAAEDGTFSGAGDQALTGITFVSGATLGDGSAPVVSLAIDQDARAATLSLEAPVAASAAVGSFSGTHLTLEGWEAARVSLDKSEAFSLVLGSVGGGEVMLSGVGDKAVTVGLAGGGRGSASHFEIDTGSGDDRVVLRGAWENTTLDPGAVTARITTGGGDDTIIGSHADETVDGGAGRDVFILSGQGTGYAITHENGGFRIRDLVTRDGDDGTDHLGGVEVVRFGDGREAVLNPAAPNRAPVIGVDAAFIIRPGETARIEPSALLANDTDPEGLPLTLLPLSTRSEQGGALDQLADGSVLFTPRDGFEGRDLFRYLVSDSIGGIAEASLVLAVTESPLVQEDRIVLRPGQAATFTGEELVANDLAPRDAVLSAIAVASHSAMGGTVTTTSVDTYLYTPPEGFLGVDEIAYTVRDEAGGSVRTSLVVEVVNAAPVVGRDAMVMLRPGQDAVFSAEALLANDRDEDGDALSLDSPALIDATVGALDELAPGVFAFTPAEGFLGTASVTYVVDDGYGARSGGVLAIIVSNATPVPVDDVPITVEAGAAALVPAAVLTGNEMDDDGDALVVSAIDGVTAEGGSLALLEPGLYLYTPAKGFQGTDQARYVVSDGYGGEAEAELSFAVGLPPDPGGGAGEGRFTLSLLSDLRFLLEGRADQDSIADLSDGVIDDADAIGPLGEALPAPVVLGAGGLGWFRIVTVTDGGGNNTIRAGDGVLSRLSVTMGDGDDRVDSGANRDSILAGGGNNVIRGFGGDDVLTAGAGDDVIEGGDGNDLINAGGGANRVQGGGGSDRITTASGDDEIDAGAGDDVVHAGGGANRIRGGAGHDRLVTLWGDDVIDGGAGDDTIGAGAGDDTISGGDGDDTIEAGEGHDAVSGGGGNDRLCGDAGDDRMRGDEGNDWLSGGEGDDRLSGGEGDDRIDGGMGDDHLSGGEGNDTIVGGAGDDLIEDGAGNDRVSMGGGNDTISNARDGQRDVFLWDDLAALITAPEHDCLEVFDVSDRRTGDVLDLTGLGDGLVLEIYGGAQGETGTVAVYLSEAERLLGNFVLAIDWAEQMGENPVLVGPSLWAHIRTGIGWSIVKPVFGDTFG